MLKLYCLGSDFVSTQFCVQCASDSIASASADSTIRLWNYFGWFAVNCYFFFSSFMYEGSCLHILEGHIGVVRCLALRGDILVSGGDRKRIIVWDVKVGHAITFIF